MKTVVGYWLLVIGKTGRTTPDSSSSIFSRRELYAVLWFRCSSVRMVCRTEAITFSSPMLVLIMM